MSDDLRTRIYGMDCFLCFQPLVEGQDILIMGPMDIPVHENCYMENDDD